MLTLVRDLIAHAEWADAVFFHVWGRSPVRDHEELRGRLNHIVVVQEVHHAVLTGDARSPDDGPPGSFDDLKARAETSHTRFREFVATLDDDGLRRTVRIPWFPDPPCIVTAAQALVQVAMHTQHHRGQCITRLRDLGGEPRNVDFVIWLWKQKPPGRWA